MEPAVNGIGTETIPGLASDLKARWIAALRSGGFEQGLHFLHDDNHGEKYCCLGVLTCTVNGARGHTAAYRVNGLGAYTFIEQCISKEQSGHLQHMNDSEGKSFAEIADWIEANL